MWETRLKKSFGNRCRQLRDQAGLSQEKLALAIGMDRSCYASIETGTRNVTLVNMSKIAHGLGVSLSELLEGVEA
ncbi:helix-turn-helix domain-containing protein [Thermophilibacter sp.]